MEENQPDSDNLSDLPSAERDLALAAPLAEGVAVIKGYLKTLTGSAGVYRMLGADGRVLYVGKARDFSKRVSSYTQPARLSLRIQRMVSETRAMEFIVTASEAEALLLECSLIKKLEPHYNILLRDDKAFPYLALSRGDFPRLFKHRGARDDKNARYFGPFASAGDVNETINLLHKAFRLRGCTDSYFEARTRPCLEYHIKRCTAPCVHKVSQRDYAEQVRQALEFLEGRTRHLQENLAAQMSEAAKAMDYETAAILRDRIRALTGAQQRQTLVTADLDDADVVAVYQEGGQACVQVFFFRQGQNYGNHSYYPAHTENETASDILSAFLGQFYQNHPAPPQILVSDLPSDEAWLLEALSLSSDGAKVSFHRPQRGAHKQLMDHVMLNAKEALHRRLAERASQASLLKKVAALFGLTRPPQRIEIYDNSHVQGAHAIGAMVVAGPEGFMKPHYRTFTIKDENAAGDDFAMMREVMRRRFAKMEAEGNKPDLVLVDGGMGQLSATASILADLGITDVPLVGIAKGPDRNAGREHFFMDGKDPFQLPPQDPVLYYLQRLRDEAHRFAIGTHRAKRGKTMSASPLDGVAGIGPKRKKALLHHFGSARAVTNASVAEIAAVEGISQSVAQQIYAHFHDKD